MSGTWTERRVWRSLAANIRAGKRIACEPHCHERYGTHRNWGGLCSTLASLAAAGVIDRVLYWRMYHRIRTLPFLDGVYKFSRDAGGDRLRAAACDRFAKACAP